MLEKINAKLDNAQEVIQTEHLASKAVTSDKIADGAITSRKLANGSVSANTIANYQISGPHLISGSITEDKLSEDVKQSISSKAEKSTTLSGYGITDVYTKSEVDTSLSAKLDNTQGVIKTDHLASKAVTTDKIADGAITSRKLANGSVSANTIANYQISESHLISGCITEDKLSDEVIQIINSKYDASNVETGSGEFTVADTYADKINSAIFEYQKNGDWVDVHVYIDFKAFTPVNSSVSITLSGLPYVCKNSVTPREICVTTLKKQMLWGIVPNTAGLTLLLFNTDAFSENEKLSYSIRYKIA